MAFSSIKKLSLIILGLSFVATSCFKDLDTTPLDEDIQTADVVYDSPGAYRQVLAKLYAGLAVSGQEGPAGLPDISGIDEGFSTYLRQYWKAQELTTDEAVIAWNDGNIHDFEDQDWTAQNEFITAMYNRIYYQIALCNEFLREASDAKLDDRGQGNLKAEVATYRAEARFLRALSYWHALDMFRNVPFVTEANGVGAFFPDQISAANLFTFIENEIKEIEPLMIAPRQNSYARADQAALWMLAAKLYLNAEVYTGQGKYTECATYAKKVIDAGFSLEPTYQHLFLADNHVDNSEVIFPVAFDGTRTQTWGGMTFITHAAVGGSMSPAAFGLDGGWGGTRTTSAFVGKFPAVGGTVVAPDFNSGSYPLLNVPGAYQGWDPASTTGALASSGSNEVYEGYTYFAEASQFKFAKGSWDVNWGDTGADGTLEPGGENLNVASGFYRINVDLNTLTYSLTPVSWGLIGSATAGGWDSDQNMTYDATEDAWTITADLVAGEAKFRANDGWDINFGDTGKDATLEYGGDNIAIPGPGNYTIKLYLSRQDYTYSIVSNVNDNRKMFHTDGQSLEITDVAQFTQGYAITKFKNVDRNGNAGSNLTFPDTDFPMFRLADAYLMYAEAILRGGAGSASEALGYVNQVRARAGAGAISSGELTLDFMLDERARELYWECHRRTDLVRFGQFSDGTYIWPLKGGSLTGAPVPAFYDVFPIPASDIGANPKLVQNPGYN